MRLLLRGAAGRPNAAVALREGASHSWEPPLKQGLRNVDPAGWIKRRPGYLLLSICIGYLKHISPMLLV